MKKLLLLLALLLLAVGCSRPDDITRESDKVFRMGVNGNTAFKNILSNESVEIDGKDCYTNYGHGEIIFKIADSTETFTIFSVPAAENDNDYSETYFRFEVESKYESSPNFVLCTYTEGNTRNITYSIYSEDGQNKGSIPFRIDSEARKYIVKVSGKFEKYKQENFIAIGTDSLYTSESGGNLSMFINSIKDNDKNLLQENSAYVVAYPWRTIKVLVEDDNGKMYKLSDINDMIDSADTVFKQAICKVVLATDSSDYDCKIVLTDNINKNVVFYEEKNGFSLEYDVRVSNSLDYAKVKNNNARNFTYAIAYLLGVSLFEDNDESSKTINQNLMDTNLEGTHLSFRQWNQLHIREKK